MNIHFPVSFSINRISILKKYINKKALYEWHCLEIRCNLICGTPPFIFLLRNAGVHDQNTLATSHK